MAENILGVPRLNVVGAFEPRICLRALRAADYCGLAVSDLYGAEKDGRVTPISFPDTRDRLYLIEELDLLLAEGEVAWQPPSKFGKGATLGTFGAARYLDVKKSIIRKLARYDLIPHRGGGRPGVKLRFLAGELEEAMRRRVGRR